MRVELDDVTKERGDAAVLDHVSVDFDGDDGILVTGPNGAGKTTLLQLVVGLLEPTSGEVLVDGERPSHPGARRRMAFVPDEPVVYSDISAEEQIEFVARLHERDADVASERAAAAIDAFGLDERRHQIPPAMSRGWRQRVSLALAWAKPFDMVLIDEPMIGLDDRGVDQLQRALAALKDDGRGFVVASHAPASFVGIAGTRYEVRDGSVRRFGGA